MTRKKLAEYTGAMQVNAAVIETVLDLVSFLLVTTDLYGEKSLGELSEKISLKAKSEAKSRFVAIFYGLSLAVLGFAYFLFYRHYEAHLSWYKANFALVEAIIHDFTGLVMIILLLFAAVLTIPVMWAVSGALRFASYLLRRWQLKGMFIAIGSVLFLAARGMALSKALRGE